MALVPLLELGRGGTSEVWLARRGTAPGGPLVVVKRLRASVAQEPALHAAMVREARIAGALRHPNIARVEDVVLLDGRPALLMAYVPGVPLAALLARVGAPLDAPTAIHIVAEVLAGLDHAHRAGDALVHRDVSPQNVLLAFDGMVSLLDFGIARLVGAPGDTRTGVVKGRVHYVAPEQVSSPRAVDHRADVFSAALVLRELLTGRRLWGGLPDAAVLGRLERGELPSWPEQSPVPMELRAIVDRASAPRLEDRTASAGAFRRQLLECCPAAEGARGRLAEVLHDTCSELRLEQEQRLRDAASLASLEVWEAERLTGPDAAPPSPGGRGWSLLAVALVVAAVAVGAFGVVESSRSAPATVRIVATPASARIFLDGEQLRDNPAVVPVPKPPQVRLEVMAPGYRPQRRTLRLRPGLTLQVELVPEPPPE